MDHGMFGKTQLDSQLIHITILTIVPMIIFVINGAIQYHSLNESAPNLVVVEHNVNGNAHYKCAFNTQVCLVIRFELTIC